MTLILGIMQIEIKCSKNLNYHTLATKCASKVNNWLDTKRIRNTKLDKNKVYNVYEKYIIKDTDKNLNSVNIISINDNITPGTIMITTNSNRKSIFSNEGRLNIKKWYEAEQQNSKNESTNTTDYIDKNTVDNTIIENESELAISINKNKECNTYNEDSHDIKSSVYKEAESVTNEATVSNDKYDDLGSDPISKEERFVKSRKNVEANQYKLVF